MYFHIFDKEQVMVSLKSLPGIHSFTSFQMFALSRIGALSTEDFSSTQTVTKWDHCFGVVFLTYLDQPTCIDLKPLPRCKTGY